MFPEPLVLLRAAIIGVGATFAIDLWTIVLKRGFGIASLNYCMLGRWMLHMPRGVFVHANIAAAEPRRNECAVGWVAHYLIGTALALMFVVLVRAPWLERPTPWPALAFGIATTIIPLFVLQPSLGLGIASSKTASPTRARLKSLMTHTVFGLGLWLWAVVLSRA